MFVAALVFNSYSISILFILEPGNGFTFVARQKRILVEDDEFFIDLVLMTLSSDTNTIVASKYQLYLPTEQQLIAEVERVRKEWKETK